MSSKSRNRRAAKHVAVDHFDAPPASSNMEGAPIFALRVWIAAMYAATLWVTHRLWIERAQPPLLPWIELPAFSGYGELLFATACLFVVWPRFGLVANVVVGLVAMTADQTRMQPQIFSFWLLMLGTWRAPSAQLLGRTHLASLWFFSGLHKLLSPEYFTAVGPWMWQGLFPLERWPDMPDYSRQLATVIASTELLLGLFIWWRRARPVVAGVAASLHVGIVGMLYSMNGWNTSVWGWNLALAATAIVFVGGWRTPLVEQLRICGSFASLAALLLFVSPMLFYVGTLDAYLCHCLYSANVPTAHFVPGPETHMPPYQLQGMEGPYWKNLNVPQPPTHRNFELYFRRVARKGDKLIVSDSRVWAIRSGWGHYAWEFGESGIQRIPLP